MLEYDYTLFSSQENINKTIALVDGELVKRPGILRRGVARRRHRSMADFAAELAALTPKQALSFAVTEQVEAQVVPATQVGEGTIARTKEYFDFPDGPGILFFDHDSEHFEALTPKELVTEMTEVLGCDLYGYDFVCRPSSSSFLYAGDKELTGLNGLHLYVGCQNVREFPIKALALTLDLLELGSVIVSVAGTLLDRYAIDLSVLKNKAGVCYPSPELGEGVERRVPPEMVLTNVTGKAVPAFINLSAAEKDRAEKHRAELRNAKRDEASETRHAYMESRQAAMIEAGVREDEAARAVSATLNGKLLPPHTLIFDSLGPVTVKQVLADPKRYDKHTLSDPLEPTYRGGRNIAIFYAPDFIFSQAHGGQKFHLQHDITTMVEAIDGGRIGLEQARELLLEMPSVSTIDRDRVEQALRRTLGVRVTSIREELDRPDSAEIIRQAAERRDGLEALQRRYVYVLREDKWLVRGARQVIMVSSRALQMDNPEIEDVVEVLIRREGTLRVDAFTFHPGRDEVFEEGGLRYYNRWKAPKLPASGGDPGMWVDLVHDMCGEHAELFLDWCAWTVQKPDLKVNWGILLFSRDEGSGKGTMVEPLKHAVGVNNTAELGNSALAAGWGDWMLNAKLALMDEVAVSHRQELSADLKNILAAPPDTLSANIKGASMVQVPNLVSVVMMSNRPDAVQISLTSRRLLMIDSGNFSLKRDTERAEAIWAWYGEGGLEAVHHFLLTRDVSNFKRGEAPPVTALQEQMAFLTRTDAAMVVLEWIESQEAPIEPISMADIAVQVQGINGGARVMQKSIAQALSQEGWVKRLIRTGNGKHKLWCSPEVSGLSEGEIAAQFNWGMDE